MAIQPAIFKGLREALVVDVVFVDISHQDSQIVVAIYTYRGSEAAPWGKMPELEIVGNTNQWGFCEYLLYTLLDTPRLWSETVANAMKRRLRQNAEQEGRQKQQSYRLFHQGCSAIGRRTRCPRWNQGSSSRLHGLLELDRARELLWSGLILRR